MPSLGTYVSDDLARAIQAGADLNNDGKPSPWIAEACRQRAEREGLLESDNTAEANRNALEARELSLISPKTQARVAAALAEIARENSLSNENEPSTGLVGRGQ